MNVRASILIGFALSSFACSSKVDEGPSGPTRDEACTQIAEALCNQYEKCFPLLIDVGFGDAATCVTRTKLVCPGSFDAPGTTTTPASASACATALAPVSCQDLAVSTPAACIPAPGALADGAACGDDAQCKSTWCAKSDATGCGKCTKQPSAGDACVTVGTTSDGKPEQACGRNLVCANGACAKPSLAGEACSDTKPCAGGLACFGGSCVAAGKAGAKCDPEGKTDPTCDFAEGVFCNPTTKVCQAFGQAKAGEPCGVVGTDYKLCVAGGKCVVKSGVSGTCLAPAADGTKCDPTDGPDCLAPAKCVAGLCKLPDPAACK